MAQDDWPESLLAEEMSITVVVNHLLLLRLHWDFKKQQHKSILLLLFVPDSYKANHEHLQKKVDIRFPKSERTLSNDTALQEFFVRAPFPPLSFLYSLYLWFLIVA